MHVLVALAILSALPDRGIFPELTPRVTLSLPGGVTPARPWLRADGKHHLVTLYDGDDPLDVVPASLDDAADKTPHDAAELLALTHPSDGDPLTTLTRTLPRTTPVLVGSPARVEDRDGDGIVDRLDIVVGARKLLENKAQYIERYVSIKYPGGDVPRTEGVCTDTVIRSLRNAGIDLQREVHEDILASPRAYPMVEKVDASINHRRVRTVVRWFERHWTRLADGTPYLPGDVVFFDTFPSKEGPDHLGVVSDTMGPKGLRLVVNNWTDGAVDAEMDLLSWVPVTHHFRAPSPHAPPVASR